MVVIHFAAAELYGGQQLKQAFNLSEEIIQRRPTKKPPSIFARGLPGHIHKQN
jgi:hypothetical protein